MIEAPISFGELFDKITILRIKKDKIGSDNVKNELSLLEDKAKALDAPLAMIDELERVNLCLWDIEDQIRIKEQRQEFDEKFIQLARSVYFKNDERAAIKKRINISLGSEIAEEKKYVSYK